MTRTIGFQVLLRCPTCADEIMPTAQGPALRIQDAAKVKVAARCTCGRMAIAVDAKTGFVTLTFPDGDPEPIYSATTYLSEA